MEVIEKLDCRTADKSATITAEDKISQAEQQAEAQRIKRAIAQIKGQLREIEQLLAAMTTR